MEYVSAIESAVGKKANITLLSMQPGDVPDTYADTTNLGEQFDYKSNTSVIEGVSQFISWYEGYYSSQTVF